MSDLISRQAVKLRINEFLTNETYTEEMLTDDIHNLPSAERTGEWEDYIGKDLGIENQWLRTDGKTVFIKCNQCGYVLLRNFFSDANYCPNCGADMRGKHNG